MVRARVMRNGRRYDRTFADRQSAEAWCARQVARIEKRTADEANELLSLVPKRVLDAVREVDYTEDEVSYGAVPATQSIGIYFLIREGRVVYVGQTKDVFLRLSKHRRDGKVFEAYNFIPCDTADLDRLESIYITAFLPLGNFRL